MYALFSLFYQIRAYNIETLIANVGGYVGLFLGYAILQTPEFFLKIYEHAKKIVVNRLEPS